MTYCKHCGANLPPNKQVRDNEQIKIEELIPELKKGYVAMDKNNNWFWYEEMPELGEDRWVCEWYICINISRIFNIAPAEDWTKSLIKIERK